MLLPNDLAVYQKQLQHIQHQLDCQINCNEALQRRICDLSRGVQANHGQLQQDVHNLSQELEDARNAETILLQQELADARNAQKLLLGHELAEARHVYYNSGERATLLKENSHLKLRLEAEQAYAQDCKDEADRRGKETINSCWRASVNEAVQKLREQDAWLIQNLSDQLKLATAAAVAKAGGHDEVNIGDSPLVKELQAEVARLRAIIMPEEHTRPRTLW